MTLTSRRLFLGAGGEAWRPLGSNYRPGEKGHDPDPVLRPRVLPTDKEPLKIKGNKRKMGKRHEQREVIGKDTQTARVYKHSRKTSENRHHAESLGRAGD